jgi:hypothetical protein
MMFAQVEVPTARLGPQATSFVPVPPSALRDTAGCADTNMLKVK